jgi:sugar phosphate isomerase/epimerase
MMLLVGLNPYGLAYTVGLQGLGTPRANPQPIGLEGFIRIAREIGAASIELDWRWLFAMDDAELRALGERLADLPRIVSYWLQHEPDETLDRAIACASAIGARTLRMHLTPVLEGGRAALGPQWLEMMAHARAVICRDTPRAGEAGLTVAIENHQDLTSEELVSIAEAAGEHVGITLDAGNPFSVGEDPIGFVERAAHRIRHLHLKDYIAQFTPEGYRLIRCPTGDGCVPFREIVARLPENVPMTASIEIAALDARHIRVFTPEWWEGYAARSAGELARALERLNVARLDDNADYRTPWEKEEGADAIVAYERRQLEKSVQNLKAFGWMTQ